MFNVELEPKTLPLRLTSHVLLTNLVLLTTVLPSANATELVLL